MVPTPLFLIPGEDYPETSQDFEDWFRSEKDCALFLHKLRWPDGFRCHRCGGGPGWPMSGGLIRCSVCKQKSSLLSGTLFHGTRKPLTLWFRVFWRVAGGKPGSNASAVMRDLGFKSAQTAWAWLHKIRKIMRSKEDKLFGKVEVNFEDILIGGDNNRSERKVSAMIALEMHDLLSFGRVRIKRTTDTSMDNLAQFAIDSVAPGSVISTRRKKLFIKLYFAGAREKTRDLNPPDCIHPSIPNTELFASMFSKWLINAYSGGVSEEHLDYYLGEYAFRHNNSHLDQGMLFCRLLQQAVATDTISAKK